MSGSIIKIISLLLCFCLLFEQSGFAQGAVELDIADHLSALRNSFIQDKFRPLHLRYLAYDGSNNKFNLLIDKGDELKLAGERVDGLAGLTRTPANPHTRLLEESTTKLMQYFFIGLALPNDFFWVNLRPDSPEQIIDDRLAQTDVGKIMLETDLQLKKDTAKFTSPETPEGRKYWDKLYAKAEELYGREQVTIPTLTRPWIVPGEIIIRETQGSPGHQVTRPPVTPSAYIYKATLKVMLEQDYLNNSTNPINPTNAINSSFKDERSKALNEYSTQLIREIIIPKLTKDVNTAQRYAALRQVYYSLILAQWFKSRFKQPVSLRGAAGDEAIFTLIDSQNLTNLTSKDPWFKTTYFQAYKKSFADGEYNIKEPVYTPTGQVIRSYMSGGIGFGDPATGSSAIIAAITQDKISGSPTRDITVLNPKGILAEVQSGTIQEPYSGDVSVNFTKEPSLQEKSVPYSTPEVSVSYNGHDLEQTSLRRRLAKFAQLVKAIVIRAFQSAWAYPGVILLTWFWGDLGLQGKPVSSYDRLEAMAYTIPVVYSVRYFITQISQYCELSKDIFSLKDRSKFMQETNWRKVLLLFATIAFSFFTVSRLERWYFSFPPGSLLYKIDHYWLNDFIHVPAIATGIYSVAGIVNLGLRAVTKIAISLRLIKPARLMKSIFYTLGITAASVTYYSGLSELLYDFLTELYQYGSPLHLLINTRHLVLGTFDYGDIVAYATSYIALHYLIKYFYGSNTVGQVKVPVETNLQDEAIIDDGTSDKGQFISKTRTRNRELSEWKFYSSSFTAMFIIGFAPFLLVEYFAPGIIDNFIHRSNLGAFISVAVMVLWTQVITPVVSFMGVYFGYEKWQKFFAPKAISEKNIHTIQPSGSSLVASPVERKNTSPAPAPGRCVTADTLLPVVSVNGLAGLTGKQAHRQTGTPSNRTYSLKPIVEVKPGDYVLSLNEETQTIEPHRIKGLLNMGVKPVFKLTTASGRSIKTTANHPYLVRVQGSGYRVQLKDNTKWVKVSELKPGDEIGVPNDLLSGKRIERREQASFCGIKQTGTGISAGKNRISLPVAFNQGAGIKEINHPGLLFFSHLGNRLSQRAFNFSKAFSDFSKRRHLFWDPFFRNVFISRGYRQAFADKALNCNVFDLSHNELLFCLKNNILLNSLSRLFLPAAEAVPASDSPILWDRTQAIEPHRIKGLLDMGVKPVYKLTTASGRSIKTTANHPYFVREQRTLRLRSGQAEHREQKTDSGKWVKVSGLKAGDEIGVAKEDSSAAVGVFTGIDTINNNVTLFNIKTDAVFPNPKSMRSWRQIHQWPSKGQGICAGNIQLNLFNNPLLQLDSQLVKFALPRSSELNFLKHWLNQDNPSSLLIFSKGTKPSFSASLMPFLSLAASLGLIGRCDSIASMSQPTGLRNTYSSGETFSSSLASKAQRRSHKAYVSKIKYLGEPFLSTTATALKTSGADFLSSLGMEANLPNGSNFTGSFLESFINDLGFILVSSLKQIKYNTPYFILSRLFSTPEAEAAQDTDMRTLQSSILWNKIISIEPLGPMQVYDIEVEGTHNFIGGNAVPREDGTSFYGGIFAHNTYINGQDMQAAGSAVIKESYGAASSVSVRVCKEFESPEKQIWYHGTPNLLDIETLDINRTFGNTYVSKGFFIALTKGYASDIAVYGGSTGSNKLTRGKEGGYLYRIKLKANLRILDFTTPAREHAALAALVDTLNKKYNYIIDYTNHILADTYVKTTEEAYRKILNIVRTKIVAPSVTEEEMSKWRKENSTRSSVFNPIFTKAKQIILDMLIDLGIEAISYIDDENEPTIILFNPKEQIVEMEKIPIEKGNAPEGRCVTADTLLPIVSVSQSLDCARGGSRDGEPVEPLAGMPVSRLTRTPANPLTGTPSNRTYSLKPIVEVKPGDYVLSLNEETQAIEPHRIKGLLDMGVKPVYKLTTASGRSIKTTANHPYFVREQRTLRLRSGQAEHREQKTDSGKWVKVSGLKAGDEIGVAGNSRELSFYSYNRLAPFANTDFGLSNNGQALRKGFGLIPIQEREKHRSGVFNSRMLYFDQNNSGVRADRKTEDITKVGIESNKNTTFLDTKCDNLFVGAARELPFQNAVDFVARAAQGCSNGGKETFISKEFHLRSFLEQDVFVLNNPYRVMNSGLNICSGKLGIAIGKDTFGSIPCLNKLKNHINRNPCSLDTGLAKTNRRVNRNSIFQGIIRHYYHLQQKIYHTFIAASRLIANTYAEPSVTGRSIKTTANHPYLARAQRTLRLRSGQAECREQKTDSGKWVKVSALKAGDEIAVAKLSFTNPVTAFPCHDQASQQIFFRDSANEVLNQGCDFTYAKKVGLEQDNATVRGNRITQNIAEVSITGNKAKGFSLYQFVNFFISGRGFYIPNILSFVASCLKSCSYSTRTVSVNKKLHGYLSGLDNQFLLISQKSGKQDTGLNVFSGNWRKFLLDGFKVHSCSHGLENHINRSTGSFDARLAMLNIRMNANVFFQQFLIVKHFNYLQNILYYTAKFLSSLFACSRWVKVSGLKAGDKIAAAGELFRPDSDFVSFYDKKPALKMRWREFFKQAKRAVSNLLFGHIFHTDNCYAAGGFDIKTQDIAKIPVKGQQEAFVLDGIAKDFAIRSRGEICLRGSDNVKAILSERTNSIPVNALIGKNSHQELSLRDYLCGMLHKLRGVFNGSNNVFFVNARILIRNVFQGISGGKKIEDIIYRNTGSLNAGLAEFNLRVNHDSLFMHNSTSLFLPKNNTYLKVSQDDLGALLAQSAAENDLFWDKIVSIEPIGPEQVYDIEVEGTHNFIGNGIFAHNTYLDREQSTENRGQRAGDNSAGLAMEQKSSSAVYRAAAYKNPEERRRVAINMFGHGVIGRWDIGNSLLVMLHNIESIVRQLYLKPQTESLSLNLRGKLASFQNKFVNSGYRELADGMHYYGTTPDLERLTHLLQIYNTFVADVSEILQQAGIDPQVEQLHSFNVKKEPLDKVLNLLLDRFPSGRLLSDDNVELLSLLRNIHSQAAGEHMKGEAIPGLHLPEGRLELKGIDVFALETALARFVSNGVRLGVKNIYVKLEEQEKSFSLIIEDDGEGITEVFINARDEQDRQKIFWLGSTTRAEGQEGGTGMCFSWHLLNMLGIDVEASKSEAHRGAKFSFTIPKSKIALPQAADSLAENLTQEPIAIDLKQEPESKELFTKLSGLLAQVIAELRPLQGKNNINSEDIQRVVAVIREILKIRASKANAKDKDNKDNPPGVKAVCVALAVLDEGRGLDMDLPNKIGFLISYSELLSAGGQSRTTDIQSAIVTAIEQAIKAKEVLEIAAALEYLPVIKIRTGKGEEYCLDLNSTRKIKEQKPLGEGNQISRLENPDSGVSTASPVIGNNVDSPGGIDLRNLPAHTAIQPISAGGPVLRDSPAIGLTLSVGTGHYSPDGRYPVTALAGEYPLQEDSELQAFENMLNAGISPSLKRIIEWLEASGADKELLAARIDKAISLSLDMFRLQEDQNRPAEPNLKQFVALLESDQEAQELVLAFSRIKTSEKEPTFVK